MPVAITETAPDDKNATVQSDDKHFFTEYSIIINYSESNCFQRMNPTAFMMPEWPAARRLNHFPV
jgi:hypothetical protein